MDERDYLLHDKDTYTMMLENTTCPVNKIYAEGMLITIEEKLKEFDNKTTQEA